MRNIPELIVMLTYADLTVKNAAEIFEQCKNTKAKYWGFKEIPLPLDEMKELFSYMRQCGKLTGLEVVEYTEEKCLAGARMAAACGCEFLMGTAFFDSVSRLCREEGIKYLPFVGRVSGRPSVLEGTVEDMIGQAGAYLEKGAYGIDLLGYRHAEDPAALNRTFVSSVNAPVCLAGSINSYRRLDEVKEAAPWSFTIGSAFFDNRFGGSFADQIDKVCDYMLQPLSGQKAEIQY